MKIFLMWFLMLWLVIGVMIGKNGSIMYMYDY